MQLWKINGNQVFFQKIDLQKGGPINSKGSKMPRNEWKKKQKKNEKNEKND